MKDIIIITGGSKGLGKALVETYLQNGYQVFSLARGKSEIEHPDLAQIRLDLSQASEVIEKVDNLFHLILSYPIKSIKLIHNAATLGEVKSLEKCQNETIISSMAINLMSPFLINAAFLRHFKRYTFPKTIFHISSGAAFKAYPAWSLYCSTKAGLEMMTKSLALENQEDKSLKIISVNPGVIDTDMQSQIRAASQNDFPVVERFIQYKTNNSLANPVLLAQKLFEIDRNNLFESGEIVHLQL